MTDPPAERTAEPGDVVAWWEGHDLAFGVVAGQQKRRLRIVTARGREERLAPARVALVVAGASGGPAAPGDPDPVASRLAGVVRRVRRRAGEVDVAVLWEIVIDGGAQASSLEELTALALDESTGEARAAMLVALSEERLRFFRRGEAWEARSREAVEKLQRQRERLAARERERAAFLQGLSELADGAAYRRQGTDEEAAYLEALEQVAVHEDATPEKVRGLAAEALASAALRYDRLHEGAFRLLRRMGRFSSDDENLQPLRFHLRTAFPAEVLAHAERRAERGFDRRGRADLTELATVSIDGADTREIDDALSIAPREAGGWELYVHIADPSEVVEPGDPVDGEALARAVTHYLPDLRLTMLPPAISEDAVSLIENAERPALSFRIFLDAGGEIERYELLRSVLRCTARLDYATADRAVAQGDHARAELLRMLATVGALREEARLRAGAIPLYAPEVDVHVDAQGRPWLERLSRDSPARRAVTEAMVLAGEVAARFCAAERLPAIYRRQAPPDRLPELPPGGARDPVAVRRLRRCLKRAEIGLQPAPHASLGLPAYIQITSPLRRYQDLATHRQILARLRGEPPPHDAEAMQRIAATTERAEADARRAERASDDYWTLRYLEQRGEGELDGIVVDTEPRPIVQLCETLREQPMPGLAGIESGTRVRLRVTRVNPRAGLLQLRPIDPVAEGPV